MDIYILARRIREMKAGVDDLVTRKERHPHATPVVPLADDATIARYVERLQAVLATGTPDALRTWISCIKVEGMKNSLSVSPRRATWAARSPRAAGDCRIDKGRTPDRPKFCPC